MESNVNMTVVEKNRKQISSLGCLLGGKYFTIGCVESYPDFTKRKIDNDSNGSLDFMPNRTPRRFVVRNYDVIGQTIKTGADGSTTVVFNPGLDTEAKAAVIAGNTPFGVPTEEAVQEALSGQKHIFANGEELTKIANEYNQNEIARLNAFIKELTKMRDGLISTIKNNSDQAKAYTQQIIDSTPRPALNENGNVQIVISPANNE